MKINFKITIWESHELPDRYLEPVLEALKEGKIRSANNLWDFVDGENIDNEHMLDAEEQMSVEGNNGQATIELYDDKDNIVWNNLPEA